MFRDGVSSSIKAGPKDFWRRYAPSSELLGRQASADIPINAAPKTISGNGTLNAKIAINEAAAIAHSQLFFNAREPILCAACTTMAVTAGLIP